jgi:hypothetical protein
MLWQSVLLVEKTGVPGENHQPDASHWQTFSHKVVSSTLRFEQDSVLCRLALWLQEFNSKWSWNVIGCHILFLYWRGTASVA